MSDTRAPHQVRRGGIRGLLAEHPTTWLVAALSVAFMMLGTGAVFLGLSAAPASTAVAETSPDPLATRAARVQPAVIPPAVSLRTCTVGAVATDPLLGRLAASVINATTGKTLFDRSGELPQSPAGTLQLLTAATALETLGAATTLSTRVIDGTVPGSIVLVGGGDATLSTTTESVYSGGPLIRDLATEALSRYATAHPGVPLTSIILDATLWSPDDAWDPAWPTSERTDGYLPFITALMVDGDRADPTRLVSARSEDPVTRAGQAFVTAAGLTGVTLSKGKAVGSTVLAEVRSQPIATLVNQMLMTGDNALAEMLARASSLKQGLGGSSASVGGSVRSALSGLGITGTDALVVEDGSGANANNAVAPALVSQLMVKVRNGDGPLRRILDGLPVGGVSGDLADRFTGDNAPAGAATQAASGWIFQERSLAGILIAADGTPLTFAFYSLGESVTFDTRQALDTLVASAYRCGANLSNI